MELITITKATLSGLVACFVCIVAACVFLIVQRYALEQERHDRAGQVVAAFLVNCHRRELVFDSLRHYYKVVQQYPAVHKTQMAQQAFEDAIDRLVVDLRPLDCAHLPDFLSR